MFFSTWFLTRFLSPSSYFFSCLEEVMPLDCLELQLTLVCTSAFSKSHALSGHESSKSELCCLHKHQCIYTVKAELTIRPALLQHQCTQSHTLFPVSDTPEKMKNSTTGKAVAYKQLVKAHTQTIHYSSTKSWAKGIPTTTEYINTPHITHYIPTQYIVCVSTLSIIVFEPHKLAVFLCLEVEILSVCPHRKQPNPSAPCHEQPSPSTSCGSMKRCPHSTQDKWTEIVTLMSK